VDFQFDATTDGRPIKIVSIVDEHTRESVGGLVDRLLPASSSPLLVWSCVPRLPPFRCRLPL